MANYLIYKVQPTLSINSVEIDYQNSEITQEYTNYRELTATVAASGGTLDLPSPTSLPSTTPFIQLQSDQEVDLEFTDASVATISSNTNIYYTSGNFKGYDFNITNNSSTDANVIWRIFW